MELDQLKDLSDEEIKTEIRSIPRAEMDEQFRLLGARRAVLMQQLEGLFSPGREAHFASIRPGGLEEIDRVIALAAPDAKKERALLAAYRHFNRVLLHFMDVYENRVFGDLHYMSKEELQRLYTEAENQKKKSTEILSAPSADYRKSQDASGLVHLAEQFIAAITKELQERFGTEPL